MLPEVFLDQYRLIRGSEGTPVEIGRNGPATTYKGADLKSGAPVALTIIPIASVDPAEREHFEEKARTAMLVDHANVAKTFAFGTTDNFFAIAQESPQGETVESWVAAHGSMPPDAVLRVGQQVVAALGAASFHGLTHPAIQPSNLIIVSGVIISGKSAGGGWPFVKLTQLALAGLKTAPAAAEPDLSASEYASPEQLLHGRVDFPSEMYSLGATMCFLLTGVFYSAYPRSAQTKRFARPLRHLIARTLEDDPTLRPQDPVLFTEELRRCLAAVERRQALQRRLGIGFPAVVAKPRSRRFVRPPNPTPLLAEVGTPSSTVAAVPLVRRSRLGPLSILVGCLLAAGLIGALLLPEDVVTRFLHRTKPTEAIGVPVGVPSPESSSSALTSTNANAPARSAAQAGISASPALAMSQRSGQAPVQTAAPTTALVVSQQSVSQTPMPTTAPMVSQQAPMPTAIPTIAPAVSRQSASPGAAIAAQQSSSSANVPVPQPNAHVAAAEPQPSPAATSSYSPNEPARTPEIPRQAQTTATPANTPTVLAANKPATPPPPAEAPAEDEARSIEQPGTAVEGSDSEARPNDTDVAKTEPSPDQNSSSPPPGPRSRSKKSSAALAHNKTRINKGRVPRALPAEPDPPSDGNGTMRARVVNVTPAGNVVLELPSGERVIVAPQDAKTYSHGQSSHRRTRRVIIERRPVFVPPQYGYPPPYQPFLPPDA